MYSFLLGVGSPKEYINKAKELGMTALGFSDLVSASGLFHCYEECKKRGIKPILGLTFNVTEDCETYVDDKGKKKIINEEISFIAKNYKGYLNLLKISSLAWEIFKYKPISLLGDILHNNQDLIAIIPSKTMALSCDNFLYHIFNNFECYIELNPTNLKYEWNDKVGFVELDYNPFCEWNEIAVNKQKQFGGKFLVTSDVYYANKEDKKIQDIFILNSLIGKKGWHFHTDTHYLKSKNELNNQFIDGQYKIVIDKFEESIKNGLQLVDQIEDYNLDKIPINAPTFDVKSHELGNDCSNSLELLIKIIKNNNKIDLDNTIYSQRLSFELSILSKKNFIDYFLIIEDIVRWCNKNEVMIGPGRGSAGGSLVSYALGITYMDPIKWNLPFERFLDISRADFPDIDLDFDNAETVKNYLKDKYGNDRAMEMGIYQTIKMKTAIKDAYRILRKDNYNFKDINDITKELDTSPQGAEEVDWVTKYLFGDPNDEEYPGNNELQRYFCENKDIYEVVIKMIGKAKLLKVHPCAMVISPNPIDEVIPTVMNKAGKNGEHRITAYDGNYVEKSGLIKFDILSLNTLKDIKGCLKYIKERKNIDIDIYNIEPNDPKILDKFRKGDTESIFQFNTVVVKPLLKDMKVDRFEDLAAATALGRPGPMGSGLHTKYINRKIGKEYVSYAHPLLESILKETYGVMCYQEQVMEIFRSLAGMSMVEANQMRKIISKKKLKEMSQAKKIFIEHSTTQIEPKLELEQSQKIWNEIEKFAKYSFNRAHSCCYAYIGYICQYLKTYHPLEWWASVLKNSDKEDTKQFLKHLKDKVEYPEINISKADFEFIANNKLIMPLKDVNQVGPNAVKSIIKCQPYLNFKDFYDRIDRRIVKKNVVLNLIVSNVFRNIEPNKPFSELIKYYYHLRNQKLPKELMTIDDKVTMERLKSGAFDFYNTDWVKDFSNLFSKNTIGDFKVLLTYYKKCVKIGGQILKTYNSITKTGKPFKRFELANGDCSLSVYCWSDKLDEFKHLIAEDEVVEIDGYLSKFGVSLNNIKIIKI